MKLDIKGTLILHRSIEIAPNTIVTVSYTPTDINPYSVNAVHSIDLIASNMARMNVELLHGSKMDRWQLAVFTNEITNQMLGIDDTIIHGVKVRRGDDAVEILP
jgi:hypothetical protein